MTNIKESINTIRNRIVANNSKISKNKVIDDSVIKDLKEAVYCEYVNFMGKIPTTKVGDFRCRQVENGKDTYYVAEGYKEMTREVFFGDPRMRTPTTVDTLMRSFVVKHGDDVMSFDIKDNKTVVAGDEIVSPKEAVLGHKVYTLGDDTDISDINQVRYQLRNNKEASYFLDKFVIVSDKEREAYRKYEAERHKEEMISKLKRRVSNVVGFVDEVEKAIKTVKNEYKKEREQKKADNEIAKLREYFTGRR